MATVVRPSAPLPDPGDDMNAAQVRDWITNILSFLEGTNLDEANVDLVGADGIVGKSTAQTIAGIKTFTGAPQINTTLGVGVSGTGYDVSLWGATTGARFHWDASADSLLLIGAPAAAGTLNIQTGELTVVDGNVLGRIDFQAPLDSAGTDAILVAASIWAEADATFSASVNTTDLVFAAATSETATAVMRMKKASLSPETTDGMSLGTTGLNWSDLFLDSGAVIDFDSGNAVITHSAGVINVSTGALQVGGVAVATGTVPGGATGLSLNDSVAVTFGTGNDSTIQYDGTNLVINPDAVGSGYVDLQGDVAVANGSHFIVGHTAPVAVGNTGEIQFLGTTAADTELVIGRWDSAASGPALNFVSSRNATIGSSTIVQDGDNLGTVIWYADDGTDFISHAAWIKGEISGTPGANDVPGMIRFATTSDGVNSATERMRISPNGNVQAGEAGTLGWGGNATLAGVVSTSAAPICVRGVMDHASATGASGRFDTARTANAAFSYLSCYSNVHISGDQEFNLDGDGTAYADGSWNGSGADYQEWLEADKELEVGVSVVLDGDKVRPFTLGDDPADIMGVTRPQEDNKNSAVVGNTAWNHWTDKYLTDDWGVYLREEIPRVTWNEVREDGKIIERCMYVAEIPEGTVLPDDAVYDFDDGRKLNPDYVPANPDFKAQREAGDLHAMPDDGYLPRAKRPEWNLIGMLGQIQIKKGETVNPRWIKMKDISANVELWFVR
jgi:hypothetical protein